VLCIVVAVKWRSTLFIDDVQVVYTCRQDGQAQDRRLQERTGVVLGLGHLVCVCAPLNDVNTADTKDDSVSQISGGCWHYVVVEWLAACGRHHNILDAPLTHVEAVWPTRRIVVIK